MVALLGEGPVSVSTLSRPLEITVTAVGQHLRVLEQAGLAISEKRGRTRLCRLHPEGLRELENWARQSRVTWEARLDRIGSVLDEMP